MRLLLFFIAVHHAGTVITTQFNAYITFKCTLNTFWCVGATLVEDDQFFDDYIKQSDLQCQSTPEVLIMVNGTQDGDGFFDDWYEMELQVQHNCTSDGSKMKFTAMLGYVKVTDKEASLKFNGDLTNVESKSLLSFENGTLVT